MTKYLIIMSIMVIGCGNKTKDIESLIDKGMIDSAIHELTEMKGQGIEYPKILDQRIDSAIQLRKDSALFIEGNKLFKDGEYERALDQYVFIENQTHFGKELEGKIKFIDDIKAAKYGKKQEITVVDDKTQKLRNAIKLIKIGDEFRVSSSSLGMPDYYINKNQLSKILELNVNFERYYWINPGCNPIALDVSINEKTIVGIDEGRAVCDDDWKKLLPNNKYKMMPNKR